MPILYNPSCYNTDRLIDYEQMYGQELRDSIITGFYPLCPSNIKTIKQIRVCKSKALIQVFDYFLEHYYYIYDYCSIIFFGFSPETLELINNSKEFFFNNRINIDAARILTFVPNNNGSCLITQKDIKNLSLKKHSWDSQNKNNYSFYINDDYKIKYHLICKKSNNKIFPELNLKILTRMMIEKKLQDMDVPNLTRDFFFQYLKVLARDNYLIKDLLADAEQNISSLYVPITFSELQNSYNKAMLLQKHKIETYKKTNLYTLNQSYTLAKIKKYVEPNLFNRFLQNKDIIGQDEEKIYFRENERVYLFFRDYYKANIKGNEIYYFIDDYVKLVLEAKEKFNLNINTVSGLKKQHDKLVDILLKKKAKDSKKSLIKTKSIFDTLTLPKQFIPLTTEFTLQLEGMKQHNCVKTRADNIKKNQCRIFCFDLQDKHYTLDIRYSRESKFYIYEMRGACNTSSDKESIEYVQSFLDKINEQIKEIV